MANKPIFIQSKCAYFGNADHVFFHDRMYTTVGAVDATLLHLPETLPAHWKTEIDLEISISKESTASTDTEKMAVLDAKRDNALTFLLQFIRNSTISPIESDKSAGKVLQLVIDNYKGIQKASAEKESALIQGLIADLSTEANAPAVTTLNLDAVIAIIASANVNYMDLYTHRTSSQNAAKLPPASEVRPLTDADYYQVCDLIEASYRLSAEAAGTETISKLIEEMNALIKQTNAKYLQSQSLKKSKKDDGNAPVTPVEPDPAPAASDPIP